MICLFIVIQNRVIKYITNIGQNTGILKASMNVQQKAISVLLVTESQNLNSGNLRINGLNSSVALVGKAGPLSSSPKTDTKLIISQQSSARRDYTLGVVVR